MTGTTFQFSFQNTVSLFLRGFAVVYLNACVGGAFNQPLPLGLSNDLSAPAEALPSASPTPSPTPSSSPTPTGVLDLTFNPLGALTGFFRPSEFTPVQSDLQFRNARSKLAVDNDGDHFIFYQPDPSVYGETSVVKTPSVLCRISADSSSTECIELGLPSTGGATPGGLHIAPDGVLYAAYLGYGANIGSLSTTDYNLRLFVCRILKSPLRIDNSYAASEGCYKGTTLVSSYDGVTFTGFHETQVYGENSVFLDSHGSSSSYVLAAGVTSITDFPLFVALDKTGDPHPTLFATWSSGEYTHLFNVQSYSEPGGDPSMDFTGGTGINFANIVGMGFQSSGKLVAIANIYNPRNGVGNNEFIAWRFDTTGALDTSFGTSNNNDGYLWISKAESQPATAGFSMGLSSRFGRGIIASDDRIFIAGPTNRGLGLVLGMKVVAYTANGSFQTHDSGTVGSMSRYHMHSFQSNITLIDTPGEVMGEDLLYFGGNELAVDGSLQTSIFALDSGSFALKSDFASSGTLVISQHGNSNLELALLPELPLSSISKQLVVLGGLSTESTNPTDMTPLISRYSR